MKPPDHTVVSGGPLVVIIGGGFGGLAAARALARKPVRILLIDRTNHHLFQPLLYQVATAGLSPAHIAKPIRSILRNQKNVEVLLDEVTGIDPAKREVHMADRTVRYDYLIVAAGARHSYFGNDHWEELAPGLKNIQDALSIRNRILTAYERAEKALTKEDMRREQTFVVIGGGPTGLEMAGAIAELAHFTLARDFRRIDPKETRIVLIEAGPRLLPAFPPDLSEKALQQLRALNVEVKLGSPVKNIAPGCVELEGEMIPASTIIWAAGNKASPLAGMLGAETDRQGRVIVNQDLTLPGHAEIQAIGDMVSIKDAKGNPVPGVAPAALQMGTHAAGNILRQIAGKAPRPFWYFDKGSLATIGRHAAVADVPILGHFAGAPAWLAWAFIHLYFLIGFSNRFFVFLEWAWAYFTYSKGARLITVNEEE